MRKIIGIGETVFDIIFKNNQPLTARPGGSVYNALISLGRLGTQPIFISEIGDDKIGGIIKSFLLENNVETQYIYSYDRGKTPLALAFLDEQQNADYLFYKDYPNDRLDYIMPRINKDDIIVIGSYFALNPVLRDKLTYLLDFAKERKAIIYYDVNFRKTHINNIRHLMPTILENFEYAHIIKGSDEDFMNIYECFYIFLMDNQNNIKGFVKISQGGITGANVDIRLIAKYAIETLATKVILVHNHPSGALMPSREDKTLTQNVSKALELFDIRVVDHLILTEDDYYSFSDEGLI
jgi:sugar/nucleoside kinase (ribokinase family)